MIIFTSKLNTPNNRTLDFSEKRKVPRCVQPLFKKHKNKNCIVKVFAYNHLSVYVVILMCVCFIIYFCNVYLSLLLLSPTSAMPLTEMTLNDPDALLNSEMEYEALRDRVMGQQDYVYTEYSLEEVIYQLAKVLFKQAMHRGGSSFSSRFLTIRTCDLKT